MVLNLIDILTNVGIVGSLLSCYCSFRHTQEGAGFGVIWFWAWQSLMLLEQRTPGILFFVNVNAIVVETFDFILQLR